jgi:acyl-CoA thioester hydrolase
MLQSTTTIRVRYGETDRMGFLYHGHYATYYEIGRTELMRGLGLTYREMEDSGYLMPVTDLQMKFMAPARYDELITVKTSVPRIPEVRMIVEAQLQNEQGQIINQSEVKLTFIEPGSNKILVAPEMFLQKIRHFFPNA